MCPRPDFWSHSPVLRCPPHRLLAALENTPRSRPSPETSQYTIEWSPGASRSVPDKPGETGFGYLLNRITHLSSEPCSKNAFVEILVLSAIQTAKHLRGICEGEETPPGGAVLCALGKHRGLSSKRLGDPRTPSEYIHIHIYIHICILDTGGSQ